jgi:hypothetical protein
MGHLQNSVGYDRARLLVPEGRGVRGFVEVDAPGGIVSRRAFEETVAALPAARSDCVTLAGKSWPVPTTM